MMAASWVSKRKPHTGIGCLMELSPFIKLPPRVVRGLQHCYIGLIINSNRDIV
jgi:hypothetical protein